MSLLVGEPGVGEQARRMRDLLRTLDAAAESAGPTPPADKPRAEAAVEPDRPYVLDPTVAANPVIDDGWYTKEVEILRVGLGAEFPQLTPATITAALDLATTRVAAGARIPNYLPVLVARDARDWLIAQLDEAGPPA
jgi:hypothetical protein